MEKITVITPTYNRGDMLERLYRSLLGQTAKDFCWLVVDDGSGDGTEALVKRWSEENKIKICYQKQENGGKHRALNAGIRRIESPLTFIVDSDDYLPEDSIRIILEYHNKFAGTPGICGYSFLRFYSNGEVNTAYFPINEEIDTYLKVRINGGIGGDKAEVFFTDVLKEYPFPEFRGEKFMPEDTVWMMMSEKYAMVHINECVYISDYLEGGLTRSGRRMKIYSPKGMMLRSKVYLENNKVCLKVKIKMQLLYIIYSRFAGMSRTEAAGQLSGRGLFYLLYIPGVLIQKRWGKE
mgnify:CR=1 FL=1